MEQRTTASVAQTAAAAHAGATNDRSKPKSRLKEKAVMVSINKKKTVKGWNIVK